MNNLEIIQDTVIDATFETSDLALIKENFAADMALAAPDLATNGLAHKIADSLFEKLGFVGQRNEGALIHAGREIFYNVGKNTLGPIAVSFVNQVLLDCPPGYVVFPARDATPFYHIAKKLIELHTDHYGKEFKIVNPVFNRKTWGVDDEQDTDSPVTQVTDPLITKMLSQIGFNNSTHVTFVEVGAWGSMIDSFKSAMQSGKMQHQDFSVYFLFTHMPEYIYGYLNKNAGIVPHSSLEAIADSFEGLPKYFKRPTSFYEGDGVIKPSFDGKLIDSPFLKPWSEAVIAGFTDAATEFCQNPSKQSPEQMIIKLQQLSLVAQQGYFNGMLPSHTETWSEGEAWKKDWKWGPTLPLKENPTNV